MSSETRSRVLLVDDEEDVTRSLKRLLRKAFDVTTAASGEEALAQIEANDPFSVIVSDMRMPGMNGAEFLGRARVASRDSVRILLTGQADLEAAIQAVNDGGIFRFLTKPCGAESFRQIMADADALYRQKFAERDVLQQTLRGSVLVLADLLGVVNPRVARRSMEVRDAMANLARGLGVEDTWQFEVAGALSHLGCTTLPGPLVERALLGEALNDAERATWMSHPEFSASLIAHVPRLKDVSEMIARQLEVASEHGTKGPALQWDPVILGGEMLRTVIALSREQSRGKNRSEGLAVMRRRGGYPLELLTALRKIGAPEPEEHVISITCSQLRPRMLLRQDLRSRSGVVLAAAGTTVNRTLVRLANNFSARGELVEPFDVSLQDSAGDAEEAA